MAHISSFIDRPVVIGRNAIGSPNIIDRSISRVKIAFSAVGSQEHGTLNLAKAVGTLSTVDIGSALFSYGSAGTLAGRRLRVGAGQFTGVIAETGEAGSFVRIGVASSPRIILRSGTPWEIDNSGGTLRFFQPGVVAMEITPGTLRISRRGNEKVRITTGLTDWIGTLNVWRRLAALDSTKARGVQLLPRSSDTEGGEIVLEPGSTGGRTFAVDNYSLAGSLRIHQGGALRWAMGSQGRITTMGSIFAANAGQKITTGTLTRPITATLGSFSGTVTSPLFRGAKGSFAALNTFGTTSASLGSFNKVRINAAYLRTGSVRGFQGLGTHLQGSITALSTKNRYIVWPTAFPSIAYSPSMDVEFRAASDGDDVTWGWRSRSSGSAQYFIRNANAVASRAPPGTIYLRGIS